MIIAKKFPRMSKIYTIYRPFTRQKMAEKYPKVKAKFSIDTRTLMTPKSKYSNEFNLVFLFFFCFFLKSMFVLHNSQDSQEINLKRLLEFLILHSN